jgi:uncharacterized LabA/DUF88 family protein
MQRLALLIDGTNVSKTASRYGMELDYALLLQFVEGGRGRHNGGSHRDIVVARVYVGPPANPTRGRQAFLDYVGSLGYQVCVCQEEGCGTLKSAVDYDILHDILVLTLTGRVDVITLVSGDGGFLNGIRTAQAHGVQVEVLAFADHATERLKSTARFQDLVDTVVLRANGREKNE